MLIGNNFTGLTSSLEMPISSYSQNLIALLKTYMDRINDEALIFSPKATEKAKIYLKACIFPNKKDFIKDYEDFQNRDYNIGKKTHCLITRYTICIMQLLGQVAECLLIDKCISNETINRICMNIALLKNDIYLDYKEIDYKSYIPFSTSFKFILLKQNGMYIKQPLTQYNPKDTCVDIS